MAEGKRDNEERQSHLLWEVGRWLNYYTLAPHVKKGKRLTMTDIAVFPWEKTKSAPKAISKEEIEMLRSYAWGSLGKTPPPLKN